MGGYKFTTDPTPIFLESNKIYRRGSLGLAFYLIKSGSGVLVFRQDKDAINVAPGDLVLMQRDDRLVPVNDLVLLPVLA
jgi:hypothetical protein